MSDMQCACTHRHLSWDIYYSRAFCQSCGTYFAVSTSSVQSEIESMPAAHPLPVEHDNKCERLVLTAASPTCSCWYRRENAELRGQVNEWIQANGPHGWIDVLRNERSILAKDVAELRAHLDRLTGMKFSDRMHAALVSRADTAERQREEARAAAFDEALQCYSPDDSATDWADKIRALKEKTNG